MINADEAKALVAEYEKSQLNISLIEIGKKIEVLAKQGANKLIYNGELTQNERERLAEKGFTVKKFAFASFIISW